MGTVRGTAIGSALCALVAALALAAPAQGYITIGHDLETSPTGFANCNPSCTYAQRSIPTSSIASGGFAYAFDRGIVTRVRFAVSAAAQVGDVAVAPRAVGVDTGGAVGAPIVVADANGVQTFPTQFPIVSGENVGFDMLTPNPQLGVLRASIGGSISAWIPPLGLGETRPPLQTSPDREIVLQADVEADADADGFGDETQDGCPAQAATQGPCAPPETFIDSKNVFGKKKNKAKVFFHSNDPAATFLCKLGQRRELQCSSPTVFSKLPPGKHKILIRAHANSTVDQTPAVAKVKVKKKRRPSQAER